LNENGERYILKKKKKNSRGKKRCRDKQKQFHKKMYKAKYTIQWKTIQQSRGEQTNGKSFQHNKWDQGKANGI